LDALRWKVRNAASDGVVRSAGWKDTDFKTVDREFMAVARAVKKLEEMVSNIQYQGVVSMLEADTVLEPISKATRSLMDARRAAEILERNVKKRRR